MQHPFDPQFAGARSAQTASLAEVLGALSYALDLAEGQEEGHGLRCCWIAMRMANQLGITGEDRRDIYYSALLKDLGCSATAARMAEVYLADDRRCKRDLRLVGQGLNDMIGFVMRSTAVGESFATRSRAITRILRHGSEIARELSEARASRGSDLARRLRMSERVAGAVHAVEEHWDGSGNPLRRAGEAIPLPARLARLAQVVDVHFICGGAQAAIDEVARRSGSWLDPRLARTFAGLARDPALWDQLSDNDLAARVAAIEPQPSALPVDEAWLDEIVAVFATIVDAKSAFTAGHSARVAALAVQVGNRLGLAAAERRDLGRAAMLHDIGKLGVSSRILDKPGPLDPGEWQAMRNHAWHTTQILGRVPVLRDLALIAGSHHERLDGAGYPMRLEAAVISLETRIVTACDAYDALTSDRAHRAALPPEQALATMAADLGKSIDGDCLAALRDVIAGQGPADAAIAPSPARSPALAAGGSPPDHG